MAAQWDWARVQEAAVRCNEMKEAAKAAQERSDLVYLCVYLKTSPVETEAIVVGVGARSFTLFSPSLGIEQRMYLDDLEVCGLIFI